MIQSFALNYDTRPLFEDEMREIACEAYVYAYPLVLMELTRRKITKARVESIKDWTPINRFTHLAVFPDAEFTDVARPNADTLYSVMWFDVRDEPLIVSIPDSNGRYYLMPILDMWTEVFASKGTRTSGNRAQVFALADADWRGHIPEAIDVVRCPTAQGWVIGRTATDATEGYAAVHSFQRGISAIPLHAFGSPSRIPPQMVNPSWVAGKPPVAEIAGMDAATFFAVFGETTTINRAHAIDYPILDRMRRIGIVPGRRFDASRLSVDVQRAIAAAPQAALRKIEGVFHNTGEFANGWRMNKTAIGTYGGDYLRRAGVAYASLGSNAVEDVLYPLAILDATGMPFSSGNNYVLHFDEARPPPARGFWSLTMYNQKQLFADNPIDRYAIRSHDHLKYNHDGSLDILIQRSSPGRIQESNWLPSPASGPFTMSLRIYWPRSSALDGTWMPPPVTRIS
jgi:hypothetical protein